MKSSWEELSPDELAREMGRPTHQQFTMMTEHGWAVMRASRRDGLLLPHWEKLSDRQRELYITLIEVIWPH